MDPKFSSGRIGYLLALLSIIALALINLSCGDSDSAKPASRAMPTRAPRLTAVGKQVSPTMTLPTRAGRDRPFVAPIPTLPVAPSPTTHSQEEIAQVVKVIDGDTIDVLMGGVGYRVRYIGIDTPETKDPNRPVEPFGPEASAKNAKLVSGKIVRLEKDVSETDRYGRLLRYVWVGDLMVNAELVRLGYALVSTYPPDVKYQDLFLRLQREARESGRGMWAEAVAPTVEPTQPSAAPEPARANNCDPSYPTVCIPPPPPDLDCGEIPYRRFPVVGADPHRFDGDHDGIGCER